MSSARSVLGTFAAAIGGVGAGIAAMYLGVFARPNANVQLSSSAATAMAQPPPISSGAGTLPISDLQQQARMDALERRMAALAAASSTDPAPTKEPPSTDPAVMHAMVIRQRDAVLSQFKSEGVDSAWSRTATASLTSDLQKLTEGRTMTIASLECRTTVCLATVHWPSYDDARKQGPDLVTFGYGVNCDRRVFALPPDDPKAPYDATLVFECEGLRSGMNN